MGCGDSFNPKDVYDFYCSKKCDEIDNERIEKLVEEGEHPHNIMVQSLAFNNQERMEKTE